MEKISYEYYAKSHLARIKKSKLKVKEHFHHKIFKLMGLKSGETLLDLGSGIGYVLDAAKSYKLRARGVDLSTSCAKICRKKGHNVILSDLNNNFPFKDQTFDSIFSRANIEHVKNPLHYLSECKRILNNEGVIFIQTNNILVMKFRVFYDYTHQNFAIMHPFSLKRIFYDLGFEIVHFRNACFPPLEFLGVKLSWWISKTLSDKRNMFIIAKNSQNIFTSPPIKRSFSEIKADFPLPSFKKKPY